jgi:hypothetical protein
MGQEAVRTRDRDQTGQSVCLVGRDAPAEGRQSIVPSSLVIVLRRRTSSGFGDPPVVEHSVECTVQGAGLEPQFAFGDAIDFLQDAVAVAILAGEREQHVKFDGPQRHVCVQTICVKHTCQDAAPNRAPAVCQTGIWTTVLALR